MHRAVITCWLIDYFNVEYKCLFLTLTLWFLRHNPGPAGVQLVQIPGAEAGDQAEAEEDRGEEEAKH